MGSYCYFIEEYNVDYLWMADQTYKKDGFGYVGGDYLRFKSKRRNNISTNVSVKGTENDPIYQTQIIGINQYKFDVLKGTYELTMLLAELKTRNENVMDIAVNDKTI